MQMYATCNHSQIYKGEILLLKREIDFKMKEGLVDETLGGGQEKQL